MVVSRLDDEPEIVENVEASARLEEESNRSEPSDSASDPEDDNDDDSEEDEKSTKARFNEILAELRASGDKIKVGNLDLGDSADRNKFMRHNKAFLREKIQPKNQTFLHLIADSDKKSLKFHKRGIKKLVTDLIQLEDEDLLAQPDQDGKTPLFCAILLKNYRLVKTMCEAHKDIQSVIRIQKGTAPSTNCLHQAIMNQTTTEDDELLKELITLSGPETLCAMNEKGLTPLHLAVEYQRCDEAQCEIVQALVERCDDICPEALDKDYFFKHEDKDRSKSKDTLSVYRYCEHSFEEYQAEQKLRSPENGVRANQKATKSTVLDERSEVTDKNQKPEKNEKQRGKLAAEDAVAPRPLRKQSTWSEAPPGKYGIKHELMKPPSAHIGAPTGKFGTRNETVKPTKEDQWVSNVLVTDFGSVKDRPQTPKQNKEPPKTSKKPNPKSQPRESNKEAIKQYLKRYYLRKKNHDEAVEFLCGSRQGMYWET
jgi:ankyrin repeat protein